MNHKLGDLFFYVATANSGLGVGDEKIDGLIVSGSLCWDNITYFSPIKNAKYVLYIPTSGA